jgi:HD-GYP domain-containing protein (c-di-GMP phosphodiesterase class II)
MSADRSSLWLAETLAEALDARDAYTAGHSLRVGDFARAIAVELGLAPAVIEILQIGAQLHDIGKIGIPDAILYKPDKLSAEEFALIKLHPQIGRRILEKAHTFEEMLSVVELHHENLDGSGYPYGLAGDRIPLGARIVRVADSFDAMTTDRAYRPAFSVDAAVREIQVRVGRAYDPQVVEAFLCLFLRKDLGELMAGGSGRSLWAGTGTAQIQDVRSSLPQREIARVRIPQPLPRS